MRRRISQPFSGLVAAIFARPNSNLVNDNIFGPTSFTPGFIDSVYEDLKKHKQTSCESIGVTSEKGTNTAGLSHMESPQDDEAFRRKLDNEIQSLFSRIPLPTDPMKAALAPTEDELSEKAESELIKEAVREAYLRKIKDKKTEELRLKFAEKQLDESKSAKEYFRRRAEDAGPTSEPSITHPKATADVPEACSNDKDLEDELAIQRNIDDMEAKIRVLKSTLKNRRKNESQRK